MSNRWKINPQLLFDEDWYRAHNPGVATEAMDPVKHYIEQGARDGRDPHPLFDTDWYLQRNPDVAAAGINPLQHFLENGAFEGRDPHPLFQGRRYLEINPDLVARGINPLLHYLSTGAFEECDPHPLFDSAWYLQQSPDAAAKRTNPLLDFVLRGAQNGRDPHPLFDTVWYLAQNLDVAASGMNPLVHYIEWGAHEGRSPHPLFDAKFYFDRYQDVAAAGADPLQHYIEHGGREGRDPHPLFDSDWYRERYMNGDSETNPLAHYLNVGAEQGCDPSRWFDTVWHRRQFKLSANGNALRQYITGGIYEAHRQRDREAVNLSASEAPNFAALDVEFRESYQEDEIRTRPVTTGTVPGGRLGAWTIFFESLPTLYDSVIFVDDPWAHEIADPLLRMLKAAQSNPGVESTLLVITGFLSRSPESKLPPGTHWRSLAGIDVRLPDEDSLELVAAIIHSLQPRVVLNASSSIVWQAFSRYGPALACDSRLLALLIEARDGVSGRWLSRADYYFRSCAGFLHGIYLTESNQRERFIADFGVPANIAERIHVVLSGGAVEWPR